MTHQYTDYLGNPIHVGDIITYPTSTGSSAANLTQAKVIGIDEIIPSNPNDPHDRAGYLHRDRNEAYPPRRDIPGRWDPVTKKYYRDDAKAYMLRVNRQREGYDGYVHSSFSPTRTVTLKNVDRVVVVTSLV